MEAAATVAMRTSVSAIAPMVRQGLTGPTLLAGKASIRPYPPLRMASMLRFEQPVVKSPAAVSGKATCKGATAFTTSDS